MHTMEKSILLLSLVFIFVQLVDGNDFYSFVVKDSDGEDFSLEKYRGQVTLVVNVASQCGYTDGTYRALKKLHDILSFGNFFSVLAFPCNQFGEQEPLEMPQIIEFVTEEYDIEFPVFNKINVVGEKADPAFKYLIEESSVVPDWNFYKYLVDESGHVIGSWGTVTTIEAIFDEIHTAVENAKKRAKLPNDAEQKPESKTQVKDEKDEL